MRAIVSAGRDCPPYLRCVAVVRGGCVNRPEFCRASVSAPNAFGVHRTALQLFRHLRRYAIGERVGVKIGVITQTVPRTIFLGCLADAAFLTFGKIIPRIVPSDGEERPVGTFQVLHQYVAGSRVV